MEAGVKQRPNAAATKAATNNRLSSVSKLYDLKGKGVLNPTEQAMRDMDSADLGYLSNEKVYRILEQQVETQNKLYVKATDDTGE